MSGVLESDHVEDGVKFIVGGGVAVVALVLYVRFVYFELSVTGRAVTYLAGTLLCLVAAATWTWKEGPGVVAALGTVLFVGYVALTHDGNRQIGLALLVGCLVALFAVTYLIQERRIALTTWGGVVAALVVLALLGGLVAVDFQEREVTYEVDVPDAVDLDRGEEAREVEIGAVMFHNDGHLRERVDVDATACLYEGSGDRTEASVSFGGLSVFDHHSVGRESSQSFPLTVVLHPSEQEVFDGAPVELAASCPESTDDARIVLVVHDATGDPAGADGGTAGDG